MPDRSDRERKQRLYLSTPNICKVVGYQPILYDPSRPDYKDDQAQEYAWKAVASCFLDNVTPLECKEKFNKVVRALQQFHRRKRTAENLPSGAAAPSGSKRKKQSSYKYEHLLAYLPQVKDGTFETEGNFTISEVENVLPNNDDLSDTDCSVMNVPQSAMDRSVSQGLHYHELQLASRKDINTKQRVPFRNLNNMHNSSPVTESRRPATGPQTKQMKSVEQNKSVATGLPINPSSVSDIAEVDSEMDDDRIPPAMGPQRKRMKLVKRRRTATSLLKNPSSLSDIPEVDSEKDDDSEGVDDVIPVDDLEVNTIGVPRHLAAKMNKQKELERRREEIRKNMIENCMKDQLKDQQKKAFVDRATRGSAASHGNLIENENTASGVINTVGLAMLKELQQEKEEDAHTLLCLSLASRLRALPPHASRRVSLKFMELLCDAEEQAELSQTGTTSTTSPLSSSSPVDKKIISLMKSKYLTAVEMAEVSKVMKAPPDVAVVSNFGISLKARDMSTLGDRKWVDGQIIDFYLSLVKNNCSDSNLYFFSTFFFMKLEKGGYSAVKSWTKKVDIFSYQTVMFPINEGGVHWALAWASFEFHELRYYNSLGGKIPKKTEKLLLQYLDDESMGRRGESIEPLLWTSVSVEGPCQTNGYDCGVFLMAYAETFSRNAKPSFCQEDMPHLRGKIAYDILSLSIKRIAADDEFGSEGEGKFLK